MKNLTYFLWIAFFAFHFSNGQTDISKNLNINKKALAVDGYDVVSYFNNEKPKKGNKNIFYTFQKATYLFDNEENKQLFIEMPEKYLPQYGGWCAYAMGENGEKVAINPKAYIISNDKLYLFYKTPLIDTKKKWNKNPNSLQKKADENWEKVIKK